MAARNRLDLRDDGLGGDTTAGDATWSGWFADTSNAGNYKFHFQATGHNMRGELVPREDYPLRDAQAHRAHTARPEWRALRRRLQKDLRNVQEAIAVLRP